MVGQRQQTLALVYSGGGDFDVVRRPLHHLDALDGRKAGQILLRLFHRVEEHTELLHLVGVAAHPLTLVPQDGEAAIVGLDGLCPLRRRQTGEPLVKKALLHRVAESAPVAEDVQPAGQAVERLVDLPGLFHREAPPDDALRLARLMLCGVGIPAVDTAQRVAAKIPDRRTVGGESIMHPGLFRHHRRQAGQRAACSRDDHDAPVRHLGQHLLRAGRNFAVAVEQGAVQIEGRKKDGVR